MSTDLFPHTLDSNKALRDIALIITGLNPDRCSTDLEPGYGPFFPNTNDKQEEAALYAAHQYLKVLKADLAKPDSCLVIDKLVVHVKTVKVGSKAIDIPDLLTLARLIQEKHDLIEPEALASGSFEICALPDKPCISIKNPSSLVMEKIYQRHWLIHGSTSVTRDSISKWAKLNNINCAYSKITVAKESTTLSDEDIPDAMLSLAERLLPDFHNDELIIALKTEHFRCINGTDGKPTNKFIQTYLKENFDIKEKDKLARIATLLTPRGSPFGKKKGTGIIMPPYDELLRRIKNDH